MNNQAFVINNNQLQLIRTGERISDEEPVFILRARDRHALSTIRVYQSTVRPRSEEWKMLQSIIEDFAKFSELYPLRMGNPSEVY